MQKIPMLMPVQLPLQPHLRQEVFICTHLQMEVGPIKQPVYRLHLQES